MDFIENLYLNFHAHQQMPAEDEIVIQSLFLQNDLIAQSSDKIFFTAGLHPWHANQLDISQIKEKLENLIKSELIIAVGETGLDKLKGPTIENQMEVFKAHIEIADQHNLPVIVHSVRAHNEVLKVKKDMNSQVPWVLHHFNGSKQMAFDLIDHGFYLSVSHHINDEKSRISDYLGELPINKVFLETDDFDIDIKRLYEYASRKFNMSMEDFKNQLIKNLKSLLNE